MIRWVLVACLTVGLAITAGCGRTDAIRGSAQECSPTKPLATGSTEHEIEFAGEARRYLLHVPRGYDGTTRLPVVVLFHGLGGDPRRMLASTQMDRIADDEEFLVVVPAGTGSPSAWDFRTPRGQAGSDLDVVADLVSAVQDEACADPDRIYAAGFSNGSALTLALACDGSVPFAGYGAVSAPYYDDSCRNAPPASVIYFAGMRDKVVRYAGAETVIGRLPSVSAAMTQWAGHNRCPSASATTEVTEHVRHYAWRSCDADTAVEVYAVEQGGHRWPGGTDSRPSDDAGDARPLDASTLIWEFFDRQRRGGQ